MRAEFPCPLLEAGYCLAYEVRPLMCRAMHSLQVEACRQELTDPNLSQVEFYLHRHIIHVSISQGLVDACLALGYQPGPVDLVQALRQYFSQPGIDPTLAGREKSVFCRIVLTRDNDASCPRWPSLPGPRG